MKLTSRECRFLLAGGDMHVPLDLLPQRDYNRGWLFGIGKVISMFGYLIPVGAGDPFPLSAAEIVIGRHKSCGIVLHDGNISGKHCKLVLSDGYWYILDLQSTNGVKVNGVKVRDRRLNPGDILSVAKKEFTIQYDPKANGASDLPPANFLAGDDIFSQSLMQRAGLERVQPPPEPEPAEEAVQTEPAPPPLFPAVREPKDFFSGLVFD